MIIGRKMQRPLAMRDDATGDDDEGEQEGRERDSTLEGIDRFRTMRAPGRVNAVRVFMAFHLLLPGWNIPISANLANKH